MRPLSCLAHAQCATIRMNTVVECRNVALCSFEKPQAPSQFNLIQFKIFYLTTDYLLNNPLSPHTRTIRIDTKYDPANLATITEYESPPRVKNNPIKGEWQSAGERAVLLFQQIWSPSVIRSTADNTVSAGCAPLIDELGYVSCPTPQKHCQHTK